jgi:Fe2+ transport system protein FeoA
MTDYKSSMTSTRLVDCVTGQDLWTIGDLKGDSYLVTRLRELGIHPGQHLQILQRFPFGGPWLLRIGQVDLALRNEEAECLWIRK